MGKLTYILFSISILLSFFNLSLKAENEINDTINISRKKNLIENNLNTIKNNLVYETDSFLNLAKNTLKLSKEINYRKGVCAAYSYIGDIYKIRNLNDSAIYYYKTGVQFADDNCNQLVSYYWNLANLYRITGNYSEALETSLRAKEIVESGKTEKYSYQIYNLLALSYQSLMEYDLAQRYFEKTADLALEKGDTAFSGVVYSNIGKLLYDQERFNESLIFFYKGIKIEKQFELWGSLGNSYTIIANIFLKTELLDSAIHYLNESTELHKRTNNKIGLTYTLVGVSKYYFKINDFKNALFYLDLTISYADSFNLKSILSESHQLKAEIFAQQKKYEQAYKEFELFFNIYSEVYDVKKINKAKALEQQLIQQAKESEMFELELKKQKTINLLLFVIIGLIIIVGGIITYYLIRVKQFNRQLKISKEKAEESDKLKSKFLQTISHEIRTPLNGLIGFSEMLLLNKNISQEELKQVNHMVLKNSEDLTSTIDNLVDIAHLTTDQYNVKRSQFDLSCLLDEVFTKAKKSVIVNNKAHIEFKIKPERKIEVFSDKSIISKILLHLVKNAFLFTNQGSIELGYNILNKTAKKPIVVVYVKDTGIGIPKDKIDVIFSAFRHGDDNLSIKVGGTGLGLSIVNKFVELINGKIWVESEINTGSTFYISFPVK